VIITIDGPAASGKSTIAAMVAQKLGVYYVSTGLLYRSLGYILVHYYKYDKEGLIIPAIGDVQSCLEENNLIYDYETTTGATVFFKGENITPYLKTKDIDVAASLVSADKDVRQELVKFQRSFAQKNSVVMEGRDIGSVIFPNADFKFFITAQPQVRAGRWQEDQSHKGSDFTAEESLRIITERDTRDRERKASPLKVPEEAVVIDTSNVTIEEALQEILSYIRH
jgi:cytidylate kinase